MVHWLTRNAKTFRGDEEDAEGTFDRIKFNLWTWARNRIGILPGYVFSDWEIKPRGVMNLLN